jgi:hypothetical protein
VDNIHYSTSDEKIITEKFIDLYEANDTYTSKYFRGYFRSKLKVENKSSKIDNDITCCVNNKKKKR